MSRGFTGTRSAPSMQGSRGEVMRRERLEEILGRLKDLRIAVVGDLFLDRWWEIDRGLDEPSVETKMTAYQVVGRRQSAGAAGTVLNNLSALGVGQLAAVSLIGDDGEGYELMRLMGQQQIDTRWVIRSPEVFTPTYIKPMFFTADSGETEGHRFDIRNTRPTPEAVQEGLITNLEEAARWAHALVVLDQLTLENSGVVTTAMRQALADLARRYPELLIVGDSRAFADRFTGLTIKCNDKEARQLMGRPGEGDFNLEEMSACLELLGRQTGRPAIITCGAKGILVNCEGGPVLVPALPVSGPIDVCGCGDACTSGMVSALCAGAGMEEAARLGNLCSAVTIRKLGTTGTASPEEVLRRFDNAFTGEGYVKWKP